MVEYVDENFRLPDQRKSKLGMWYTIERNRSHTTARGDRIQAMKVIVSILYNCSHLRQLGSYKKISMKKMISELKSIAWTGKGDGLVVDDPVRSSFNNI
jgi:hypothetical protein